MSKYMNAPRSAGGISFLMSGLGPQIMLDTPNEGQESDDAAAQAATKAAAEKAAADKAAADKAAADEAARIEAEKNMTDAEKEKQKLLREVMDKKNKLKEAEAEKERVAAELKKFEGIDLERVKALLEAEKTREEKELEAKGEFDRLKQRIAEERAAEKKAYEERIAALEAATKSKEGIIDELTIGQSFATSTFINEELVLTPTKARVVYGKHFELKDGKIVAYDKPAGAAGRTMIVDAAGDPVPFEEALAKIVKADPDFEKMAKSKAKPGSGSKTKDVPVATPGASDVYGASRIASLLGKKAK